MGATTPSKNTLLVTGLSYYPGAVATLKMALNSSRSKQKSCHRERLQSGDSAVAKLPGATQ